MTVQEFIAALVDSGNPDNDVIIYDSGRFSHIDTVRFDGDYSTIIVAIDEDTSSDNLDDLLSNL